MLKISSVYFVYNFYLLLELYTRNIELDMKNHKKKKTENDIKINWIYIRKITMVVISKFYYNGYWVYKPKKKVFKN